MSKPTTTCFAAELHAEHLAVSLHRAQADVLEMPGLELTGAQAARLWCFDSELCSRVLSSLVESRFLMRTRDLFTRPA